MTSPCEEESYGCKATSQWEKLSAIVEVLG